MNKFETAAEKAFKKDFEDFIQRFYHTEEAAARWFFAQGAHFCLTYIRNEENPEICSGGTGDGEIPSES